MHGEPRQPGTSNAASKHGEPRQPSHSNAGAHTANEASSGPVCPQGHFHRDTGTSTPGGTTLRVLPLNMGSPSPQPRTSPLISSPLSIR